MKPNDKAIEAAALAIQQHGPESHVARLIAQVALHAAFAAQFHPSDEYAGLVERLNILDGNETQWSAVWEIAEEAADALEALLAERDALKAELASGHMWIQMRATVFEELAMVRAERDRLKAEWDRMRTRLDKAYNFISGADWEQFFQEEHVDDRLSPVDDDSRHLTAEEQKVFHSALRRSAKSVAQAPVCEVHAPSAMWADGTHQSKDDEALVEIAMEEVEKAIASSNDNETVVYRRWEAEAKEAFRAAIAAIRPHIEAAEREKCAKIAELHSYPMKTVAGTGYNNAAKEISAAIRRGKS